jgi:Agglutinin C-terminal
MLTLETNILMAEFMRVGVLHAAVPLADRIYTPPKSEWLLTAYDAWFRQCLAGLNSLSYVAEAHDCDDFAQFYATFAKICHRKMGLKTALPIGIFYYEKEGQGKHAINVAYTSDLGLIFIEPQQRGTIVNLTNKEKLSSWLLAM